MSGEPDWATPGASSSGVPAPDTGAGSAPAASANSMSQSGNKGKCVQRFLSFLNLILCAGMMALGVLGIINFSNGNDIAELFVSIYMMLFASLLAAYELMWWVTIDKLNKSMRKNFGFLYGIKGKALYMIFVAFLAIGLEHKVIKWLQWGVGIAFLAVGVLQIFIALARPQWVASYRAPTGGLPSGDNVEQTV